MWADISDPLFLLRGYQDIDHKSITAFFLPEPQKPSDSFPKRALQVVTTKRPQIK